MATMTNTATGVQVAQTASVAFSPTAMAQIAATAGITGAAMGGPWGAAVAAVGAVGVFALPAFADAYARAKMRVNPSTGAMEKSDPSVCTVAPCAEYKVENMTVYYASKQAACSAWAASLGHGFTGAVSGSVCNEMYGSIVNSSGTFYSRSVSPSPEAYQPINVAEASALIASQVPTVAQVEAMQIIGYDPMVPLPTLTGPAEVFKGNTVELGLDGTVKEIEERYIASYQPGLITIGVQKTQTVTTPAKTSTTTTVNPDGSTSTGTTTTPASTTTKTTTTAADQTPKTCGVSGSEPCKIDETGTPEAVPDTAYKSKLDKTKTDQDALRDKVGGNADKSFFANWQQFFVTPPLATCRVYELPNSLGSVDPCPVVDGVRSVMAFLWAVTALWQGIKMVREVV